MRFYLLSPANIPENPHLFPYFLDTWKSKGIQIVDRIEDCDVVLVDFHTRVSDYDQNDVEYIMDSDNPLCCFDEFDKGSMSLLDWPYPLTKQLEWIFYKSHKVKSVHFCRLLNKTKKYPDNVYPYERTILYQEPMLSPNDLFNREFDVVGIMNTAPQREAIKKALEEDGRLKCNIILGAEKIPLNEWINEHKRGKLFLSASGGGYSSEKPQHLFSVAAMLQERTDQLLLQEPQHIFTCIKIDSPPTKYDIDIIVKYVNDKELLYDIYQTNYNYMTEYYSAEYIATDILNKILKHVN